MDNLREMLEKDLLALRWVAYHRTSITPTKNSGWIMADNADKNDAIWREKLTPEQYQVCRQKGTERAFTGEYWDTKTPGVYLCRCCATPLFDATTKYDSGSGWPSFYAPVDGANITEDRDVSHGMVRTEITCAQCGSHLGHVFPDGPAPTGLRYCLNSASLELKPDASNQ